MAGRVLSASAGFDGRASRILAFKSFNVVVVGSCGKFRPLIERILSVEDARHAIKKLSAKKPSMPLARRFATIAGSEKANDAGP